MKRTSKLMAFAVGAALLGLSLSGCVTVNTAGDDDMGGMDHGSNHSMTIKDKQSFAEAMIPHHQQAIDMSEFADTNTSNPGILAIASKITSEQGPEIEKMTPWLEGKSVDSNMMMDGMLSPIQLSALRASKDADFDKLYVQYMIQHHEGAIKMAADALGVDDPELTDFANEIIVMQSAEIEELMALLNN
jgi:uncharacterized protein (DUF305 family)